MKELFRNVGGLAVWMALPAMLMWRLHGGWTPALIQWSLISVWIVYLFTFRNQPKFRASNILLTAGATCNAIAVLSNHASMPAIASDELIRASAPAYVHLTAASHFWFLCDIFHGFSVGDFLIFSAFPAMILGVLFIKSEVSSATTS